MELLTKLANHFDVSVSYLVGEVPPDSDQEELIVLYRDLKDLDEKNREAIRGFMRRYKEKKDST